MASCGFKPGKSDGVVHCSVENAVLCNTNEEEVEEKEEEE